MDGNEIYCPGQKYLLSGLEGKVINVMSKAMNQDAVITSELDGL